MTEHEFNTNIKGMRNQLIRFAEGFTPAGAATPEDMVQEAIIRVWKLQRGGEDFRSLQAISYTILKNICLDYIKLKKNNTQALDTLPVNTLGAQERNSPYQVLETKEQIELLKTAIRHLPADQQVVLRLRDVMGYELEEIAQVLETSSGNVRTLLSRARGKLRIHLINYRQG